MNFLAKTLFALISLSMTGPVFADNKTDITIPFSTRTDVNQFIKRLVQKDHFKIDDLSQVLDQVELQPVVLEKIQRPYEAKPWFEYRNFFMTNDRVTRGVEFWRDHEKELQRAESQYGVPAEIIVAILGVETFYGNNRGDYRVLDALSTLAFNYPPRAQFFQSELRHFLLLAREQKFAPTTLKGSYAGAMGYPQFMPSSYRSFAVDFSGNSQIDLLTNPDDAIGSIANYFKEHGWQANEPIAFPAVIENPQLVSRYLDKQSDKSARCRPVWRLHTLQKNGISLAETLNPETKVALIDLQERDAMQYWIGLTNLYVITRYNSSVNYAMVVYDLSQKLKAAHEHPTPRAL